MVNTYCEFHKSTMGVLYNHLKCCIPVFFVLRFGCIVLYPFIIKNTYGLSGNL